MLGGYPAGDGGVAVLLGGVLVRRQAGDIAGAADLLGRAEAEGRGLTVQRKMEWGPGEARAAARVLVSDPAAASLRAASLVLPGLSGPAPPNMRDSLMAASRTIGSSARGLGGRMRMVGALTDITATT